MSVRSLRASWPWPWLREMFWRESDEVKVKWLLNCLNFPKKRTRKRGVEKEGRRKAKREETDLNKSRKGGKKKLQAFFSNPKKMCANLERIKLYFSYYLWTFILITFYQECRESWGSKRFMRLSLEKQSKNLLAYKCGIFTSIGLHTYIFLSHRLRVFLLVYRDSKIITG